MHEIDFSRFGTTWDSENPQGFDGATAFKNMRAEFDEAAAKTPYQMRETFFVFGGRSVRVRVVGHDLAEHFVRPFSHLQANGRGAQPPELTIDLWDDESHRDRMIAATENDLGWTESTVQSSDDRFIAQRLPHTFSCLDREANQIVATIAWHDRIFIYERAKPLARLLLKWHNDQDVQVIHTGLVASDGKGILFAGKSGSGKSTSSLACISAGLGYLGEDYVGLESRLDGSFVGHSLYNSIFLETGHLERFEELRPFAVKGRPPHELKSVIILSQVFPERLQRCVPIRALALLRVTEASKPRFRRASKGEALLTLGPSSLLQIPNRKLGTPGFQKLAELVERLPCFWLEVGTDLRATPVCVTELLAQVNP
jgi:hypothetical protein